MKEHSYLVNELTILNSSPDKQNKDCLQLVFSNKNGGTIYSQELFSKFTEKAETPKEQFLSVEKLLDRAVELGGELYGDQ